MVDSNKTVLVVTPHPDDAEGGAGGTIVKWANEGNKIVLLVCTNGDKKATKGFLSLQDRQTTWSLANYALNL